jgi:hypothetical protein
MRGGASRYLDIWGVGCVARSLNDRYAAAPLDLRQTRRAVIRISGRDADDIGAIEFRQRLHGRSRPLFP